jgi:hypothetical protein
VKPDKASLTSVSSAVAHCNSILYYSLPRSALIWFRGVCKDLSLKGFTPQSRNAISERSEVSPFS